jgi:lipopolysaccharide/colanic/teichoic acid biosynthesis glycosyltransferase
MSPPNGAEHGADPSLGLPGAKRWFDLGFCLLTAVVWLPLALTGMLAVLIGSGWPAVYVSSRIVYRGERARVIKLRAMVRNAAEIANRRTVPIGAQRFLNIDPDSELYTPVGRIIERLYLTEITQFFHVLSGKMSVIGNRPLPADVVEALTAAYPAAEDRFLTRAGLTGPAQLVGRAALSDEERLSIEIAYCRYCLRAYSMRLDVMIILYTVLILARLRKPMTASEVATCMASWAGVQATAPSVAPRAAAAHAPTTSANSCVDDVGRKDVVSQCPGEG